MFNLFGKKIKRPVLTDRLWIKESAKFSALKKAAENNSRLVVCCWFPQTLEKLEVLLQGTNAEIILCSAAHSVQLTGRTIVFAEHHPLLSKEYDFAEKYKLDSMETWSSLDEPLLKIFSGDRIAQLMKTMGLDENQYVEHKMISASIHNAQEKLGRKITMEMLSRSQEDWLKNNLSS
jgi:hypothetical protein